MKPRQKRKSQKRPAYAVNKSFAVKHAAKRLGVKVIDLPLLDPVDVRGFPHV